MMTLDHQSYRDVLSMFMGGRSVATVRGHYPKLRFAIIAEAYFAVQSELGREYSPQLSTALTSAAMSRGVTRATVVQRALETLARQGLIDHAVSGQLRVSRAARPRVVRAHA